MTDPRFFKAGGPFALSQLAEISGASIEAGGAGDALFNDVAPIDVAGPDEISFLNSNRYLEAFANSKAGACVTAAKWASKAPEGMAVLVSKDPHLAFAYIAQAFYPREPSSGEIKGTAIIDPTARLGAGCDIADGAIIEENAEIGENCRIDANAVIGAGVVLGDDCTIGAGATLSHCIIGSRVLVYPGVRIGQDGFGFATDAGRHVKIPQLGRVIVHDDVEIGANTTIDRGSGPDTIIGAGCMIDNLVQIGHNVQLGKGCVIVALAGLAGSTKLGDFVVVGGQVGIAGHLEIGSGVQIAAKGGVIGDVPPGITVSGLPAVPIGEWRRQVVALARLAKRKGK